MSLYVLEKPFMEAKIAPIIHLLLVLSYLVVAFDDEVSVCHFQQSLATDTASSMADCSRRNTVVNNLPETEKRLRYDPFPELFSANAVDSFKRYRRFRREKSATVDGENKQHLDKNKKPVKKVARIQEWDPDDGMKCVDISKYSTVIDFSCTYLWSSEVFHHTFDCLMGNYNLFKAAQNHNHNSTILIVPYEETKKARMMPFVDFFLQKDSRQAMVVKHRYLKLGGHPRDEARFGYQNHDCFVVNTQATVMYTNLKTLWLDYYAIDQVPPSHPNLMYMMKTAQRFQKAIQTASKSLDLQKSSYRTILFIHRSEIRVLSNSDALIQAINDAVSSTQLHGQLQTTIFYGNETFTDTMLLFQQAAVVVAFHGAGLVNTIYCSNDAVIVELSIAAEPQLDRKPKDNDIPPMWRSNHVIGTLCQLHWVTYLLRPTNSLLRLDKEKSGFLFQSHLHTITILQSDIAQLATIIKEKTQSILSSSTTTSSTTTSSSLTLPLYVSKQTQGGTFEVYTSKDPNAITPMSIFGKIGNPSITSIKPKEKIQSSRTSPPSSTKSKPSVKTKPSGEGRGDRNKKKRDSI